MPIAPRLQDSDEARRAAQQRLPRLVFDYIDGGAGNEIAMAGNRAALARLKLQPRVLAAHTSCRLGTTLLGQVLDVPFGIAPMGMCNLAWPGADRMLSEQAVRRGMPHGVSTAASTDIETLARTGAERTWFQLYVTGSPEDALGLADRAARAGCSTLILTVDVPRVAPRPRDLRNGFTMPFRIGPRQFADFARHPRWSLATLRAGTPSPANFAAGGAGFNRNASRAGANWSFLERLRRQWTGHLIVKGVMAVEDARRIRSAGADAIYVSNHGGRQLDAAPSALGALARIRQAMGPGYPLIFDSGVRSAEDVVKALAAGANHVMLGRPLLYALGAGGRRGLAGLLDRLTADLDIVMAQLGIGDVADIGPGQLAPGSLQQLLEGHDHAE